MQILEFIANYGWTWFYAFVIGKLCNHKYLPHNSWQWWAYVIPMVLLVALAEKY